MPRLILAFLPLPYLGGDDYWHRDAGLLVKALRQMGEDAKLVLHPGSAAVPPDIPLLLATREEAFSPTWWKQQQPWAVVLNTWGAPRYIPMWAAIKETTTRLVERLDTDGNRSPRTDWRLYVYAMWSRIHDFRKRRWRVWFSAVTPFLHLALHTLFSGKFDRPMAMGMASLPILGAESPIAVSRIERFLRSFDLPADQVHCLPHPVEENDLPPLTDLRKEKTVISVGRWESHQKNFPLQLRVLNKFLQAHPDWSAVLIGTLPKEGRKIITRLCPTTAQRIATRGQQSHQQIYEALKKARIFLMSSRHESFGIAAAEALCCGCSVVGPAHIASVPWFCEDDSGTVSPVYTKNGLLDALDAEAQAWEQEKRQPARIAAQWRIKVGATAVARRMLHLLEELHAKESSS